ncbi:hypothetical protein [Algoriphagus confluentis]|uniref:Uncharacterized protein n=1 Tax=Algoriphagus confluentis TaxID=1697556 RepID=A0ABQ6PU94_9BACT|nr:hypothetical protein Aconfl_34980 [Algoriphagus confluentis]
MANQFRPDQSDFLAHFSSGGQPVWKNDTKSPIRDKVSLTAIQRLISILTEKKIIASTRPWIGSHAVCFTECPRGSLLDHTNNYSQLALYQKTGYEIVGIEKDFFIQNYPEPIFENGIPCKHKIILEKTM